MVWYSPRSGSPFNILCSYTTYVLPHMRIRIAHSLLFPSYFKPFDIYVLFLSSFEARGGTHNYNRTELEQMAAESSNYAILAKM